MIRVTESVYFSQGENEESNSGFVVRDSDIIFVDAADILEKTRSDLSYVAEKIRKPIKYLVNTHFHSDHTFGNQLFNCDIIATYNAPKLMKGYETLLSESLEKETDPETLRRLREIKLTYANTLLQNRLVMKDSHPKIEIIPLGGHTADSLVVFVPSESVVFTGDLIFEGTYPFTRDADIDVWVKALDWLKNCGASIYLPGHGNVCNANEIDRTKDYLVCFKKNLRKLRDEGVSLDEIVERLEMLNLPKPPRKAKWEKESLIQSTKTQYPKV